MAVLHDVDLRIQLPVPFVDAIVAIWLEPANGVPIVNRRSV